MMLVSDLYCPSCRNAKDHKPQDNEVCWSCVAMGGAGNYKESKTHYDLLIRKTPEEMAEFLWSIGASPFNGAVYINGKPIFSTADGNKWLDWLKQEAQDG